jgi:predicted small metal-binding protein
MHCDFKARGKTVEEVLDLATQHAKKDHGIAKITKDYLDSWQKKIRDE